ncbi:hypothetical protein [Vibrio jasicida]|uniref:hypothetical protein n=1 Tax=Vibrio jasicida TaxID=766224 RepID=UPI001CA4726A|nr:hypothetical protein [Vibrio jasicida]
MNTSKEVYCTPQTNECWIYVGATMGMPCWCKVGKTTRGLETRHTSSQNPSYFIHTAFHIIRGDIHQIERQLLNFIVQEHKLERIQHIGTQTDSECFYFAPDEMVGIVEQFIERYYPSSVTYETTLHGFMSRYVSPFVTNNYPMRQTIPIRRDDYRTGNQEIYEIDLGNGYFLDISSGQEFYREDEDESDY